MLLNKSVHRPYFLDQVEVCSHLHSKTSSPSLNCETAVKIYTGNGYGICLSDWLGVSGRMLAGPKWYQGAPNHPAGL